MTDITSANAVYILSVPSLIPVPVQLQGFAADDVFDTEDIDATETIMGVDGNLSAGIVLAPTPQNITFQADSASIDIFENWYFGQKQALAIFPAQATVTLPSRGKSWSLSKGILRRFKSIPDAKRTLQPQRYQIMWQTILPTPVGTGG